MAIFLFHRVLRRSWLIGLASIAGCAPLTGPPPMMGTLNAGTYTQPSEHFSCPITSTLAGLEERPRIVDAHRRIQTETIPLSQRAPGDWKHTRIVSDGIQPSRLVRFEYPSGALIEFSSGTLSRPADHALNAGLTGGFAWQFVTQERSYEGGRLVSGLLLVPWHEEAIEYMGVNIAESYRQGQGPDPELWIRNNLLIGETIHVVTIRLPAAPFLPPGTHPRDLPAIRDSFIAHPARQQALLEAAKTWLDRCEFSERRP